VLSRGWLRHDASLSERRLRRRGVPPERLRIDAPRLVPTSSFSPVRCQTGYIGTGVVSPRVVGAPVSTPMATFEVDDLRDAGAAGVSACGRGLPGLKVARRGGRKAREPALSVLPPDLPWRVLRASCVLRANDDALMPHPA
jgi:hypothetical protein